MAKKLEKDTIQEEPSVLDYLKAVFSFGKTPIPEIPELPSDSIKVVVKKSKAPLESSIEDSTASVKGLPWKAFLILILPVFAQSLLQSTTQSPRAGIFIFLIACGLALWAMLRGEVSLASGDQSEIVEDTLKIKPQPLLTGVIASLVAFVAFGGNQFTFINVTIWLVALYYLFIALWPNPLRMDWFSDILDWFRKADWQFSINRRQLLFVLVLGIGIFFRTYRLGQVMPEMFSDQAEKLLDVVDIIEGDTRIFFERNTGRESFQMYLTALVIGWFNTGITFLSLKIATVMMGIFSLPFIYLIGKEIGNRWVGLIAMFLAGVSFWPNVLARSGLRFILYPAFAAPVIYFVLRGLRKLDRKDFMIAGIFLGMGLHGYSPFRVTPILVVVMFVLFLIHKQPKDSQNRAWIGMGLVSFISLIVFLPLLRYWIEEPAKFNYRALTRMGNLEIAIQGEPILIFLQNVWDGLLMFNWSDGTIWLLSFLDRPLLDVVMGGMLIIGAFLVLVKYIREGDWRHLFLLVAIPIMMLPSTLSIAFPNENPAPNRAGGVMIIVFVLAALALEALFRAILQKMDSRNGVIVVWGLALFLGMWTTGQNYDMVFNEFQDHYIEGPWNTSELGDVIQEFTNNLVEDENAWVVAFPHWVDTRLVGMNAGFPNKDLAIWPDEIEYTTSTSGAKIFLFKPEDNEAIRMLEANYPNGSVTLHESEQSPLKNFYIYFVPAE